MLYIGYISAFVQTLTNKQKTKYIALNSLQNVVQDKSGRFEYVGAARKLENVRKIDFENTALQFTNCDMIILRNLHLVD